MIATMKNKVQLVGRLGKDPELRTLATGHAMLRMSIATNERCKGAEGQWKDETQWHPVVAWGKQAERMAAQLRKGSGIVVEGRLVHRSYAAKDGTKRVVSEVVISDYQLLAPKADALPARQD
ncbi:MAG: single-stranded DNA-binding protein [Flavobacteriales bacterium]